MAEKVPLPGGEAKIRNLWIVLVLLVVTLGIYYLYWYYALNRELRDFGSTRDTRLDICPGVSLHANRMWSHVLSEEEKQRLGMRPEHARA